MSEKTRARTTAALDQFDKLSEENALLRGEIQSLQRQHELLLDEFGRIQNQELKVREELLQKSLFLDAVLNSQIDFFFKDRHGRFLLVSRGTARKLCGSEGDPAGLIGKSDSDYFDEQTSRRFRQEEIEILRDPQQVLQREDSEGYPDGRRRQIVVTRGPVRDPVGRVIGTYGVTRDVTDLMSLRIQIEAILQTSVDAIVMLDAEGRTVVANPAVESLFGFTPDEVIGTPFHELLSPPEVLEEFRAGLSRLTSGQSRPRTGKTLELQALRKDGSEVPAELTLSAVELNNQWFTVGIVRDITERKESERRLHEMAERDGLTGLFNQSVFPRKLEDALSLAVPGKYVVVVADLDRFKPVNDQYGHPIGDQVLVTVSNRLRDCVKASDLLGRLGGDEFAIGMDMRRVESVDLVSEVARSRLKQIKERISRPYRVIDPLEHVPVSVDDLGISLGFATFTSGLGSAKDLLRAADEAMYLDKAGNKGLGEPSPSPYKLTQD